MAQRSPNIEEYPHNWRGAGYPERHVRKLMGPKGFAVELEWPDDEKVDKAARALNFAGSSVVLVGPRGTGKTQLATYLGLVMAHVHNPTQKYSTLAGLLQDEKDSWNRPPELDGLNRPTSPLKKAKEVGLLVLDEVQEIAGTDWEMAQFVRLFDERYGAMKRTILISNQTPEALKEFVGPSVWSRITETGLLVLCGGEGWTSFR